MIKKLGREGIVSKRFTSRYKSGPWREWLKRKAMPESEFVVVAADPHPGGASFGRLAKAPDAGLVYVGSAFVTSPEPERERSGSVLRC